MNFRRGIEGLPERPKSFAARGTMDMSNLPEAEKERLCRSLLAEFGVTQVRLGAPGELIHGCVLPFKDHHDQERNPTASLNYQKLTYNCFGCGGGSLMWFIAVMRDTSGAQARQWLAEQTGFDGTEEIPLEVLLRHYDSVYNKAKNAPPPMPRMDARVLDPWLKIHPYMTEVRGIPEETLIRHKVGYGVFPTRVSAEKVVDSHRIVIPHFWRENLVGWQTRRLFNNDGTPKYKSSPDFPKDRTLYNYDQRQSVAVVVESPLSVLSKGHLPVHIEATFGASVTDLQMRLLSMHYERVILFGDNDASGWTMNHHLGEFLSQHTLAYVADNPYNADAADLDDETYLGIIERALPFRKWKPPKELVEWESPSMALAGS